MTEQRRLGRIAASWENSWRRTYGPIVGEDTAVRISGEYHAPDRIAADLANIDMMSFVAERATARSRDMPWPN